jgi:hypothetical protein
VFAAFDVSEGEANECAAFVRGLAPAAGLTVPLGLGEDEANEPSSHS